MTIYQRTLSRPVACTGIGLHSGRRINLCLRPAEPDTGVVFKRTDIPDSPLIPGDVNAVVSTEMCTTVGSGGACVATVEHLMSALAGVGVDNVLVEVDAPEIPVMDGSSAPFVFLLKHTGLKSQDQPRKYFAVRREVCVSEGDKFLKVLPADHFSVDYTIEFDHPLIRRQRMVYSQKNGSYDRQLSRARTFGFLSEFRRLQEANLALGGSLDNAVVVDDYRVLNDDGLRFDDEFVRHKVLDFVGDMALVGRPIMGAFVAHKSGHALNNKLFRKFLADPQAWQLVSPEAAPLDYEAAGALAMPQQAVA